MDSKKGIRILVSLQRVIAMKMKNIWNVGASLATLALAAGLAGCMVHVDKDANGNEKHVQVDTPFGGVHVNTNQTTASDLGLPVYPGATLVKDKDGSKSADVHLGFGEFQLRVRAVSYESADSETQITAFYKKALGRYGDVITCQYDAPVGAPAATHEGLTCNDDKNHNVNIGNTDRGIRKDTLQLKAGSRRHQHILGFDNPVDGKTRFALVSLDLPAEVTESSTGKSD
ncbi:MAG: hypothetical protein WAN35_21360 [Terracidiphilus sp.]